MIQKGSKAPYTGALLPADMLRSYEEMGLENDILKSNIENTTTLLNEASKCQPSDPMRPFYFFGLGVTAMALLWGFTTL